MNEAAETTYEEYLEAVRTQQERDRDRFTGRDSHAEQPMYSAETGQPEFDTPAFDWDSIIRVDMPLVDVATFDLNAFRNLFAVQITNAMLYVTQEILDDMNAAGLVVSYDTTRLLRGDPNAHQPLGILNATPVERDSLIDKVSRIPAKHTYPKPRREWWRR